jgi:2-polyprenyl-3-methyl-5-hydroxy-6-metoxy-1,4-benzoquinol methylase
MDRICDGCGFCGCKEGRDIYPKEMYFGTRKAYRYFHCSECGALSCKDTVPVSEAYPENYYSFQKMEMKKSYSSTAKYLLRKLKANILLDNFSILRQAIVTLFSEHYLFLWFRLANLKKTSSILDIGCGTGSLLLYLDSCGFKNLNGIDPNIESDIFYENGVSIRKKTLDDVTGKFDFIMFQNVIEHIPDPTEALTRAGNLLNDNGHILIFTPVSDCYAFRKYGAYWASIDAPRHLAIPSTRSMHVMAEKTDFSIMELGFLSSTFQLWNSELYLRNISTMEAYSGKLHEKAQYKMQMKYLSKAAKSLDDMHDGDTAMFLLKKKRT